MREELVSARLRCEQAALYIVETGATVREAAEKFGVSKSTVHKDVTERLPRINRPLYFQVRKVLFKNKKERHLRGGEATRKKYLLLKNGVRINERANQK